MKWTWTVINFFNLMVVQTDWRKHICLTEDSRRNGVTLNLSAVSSWRINFKAFWAFNSHSKASQCTQHPNVRNKNLIFKWIAEVYILIFLKPKELPLQPLYSVLPLKKKRERFSKHTWFALKVIHNECKDFYEKENKATHHRRKWEWNTTLHSGWVSTKVQYNQTS